MSKKKNFLSILQSVDSFFPIGAFTLSNGLEDYVLSERIGSCAELNSYLDGFLQIFPYGDLGLLNLAYQYAGDIPKIVELDHLSNAMKSAQEVRSGSIKLSRRYLKARGAMNDCPPMLQEYQNLVEQGKAFGFHPIALGIYAVEIGIDLEVLLQMYAYSIMSAIVNNTVKLVPLSQLEGQRILFECLDKLEGTIQTAKEITIEDLGVSGAAFEIHCMNHERLYSRQYMS